jgi:tetratricopeptide (TPR) repeat protein
MYDSDVTAYRQVLTMDPKHPRVHFRIGRVMLARGRPTNSRAEAAAQALKEFEQEPQLDPTNANAAYEIGEIRRNSGEFNEARSFFEKALEYYPDFEDALIGLRRTLLSLQEKPELALPRLKKAVAIDPKSAVSFFALAQAYRALGNTAEQTKALAEFRRLRDMPAPAEARRNTARGHEAGDRSGSVTCYF